jgi:translation initiation factor 1A
MRKKVWVNTGDVILLGLRDFQDEKADVILKYLADEARSLKVGGGGRMCRKLHPVMTRSA